MRDDCVLCGGKIFREIARSVSGDSVVKCVFCGLVKTRFASSFAPPGDFYDEKYYAPWLSDQSAARLKIWRRRLSNIEKLRRPGRLFDAGCGDGLFLETAAKNGWTAEGCEISSWAADYASQKRGLRVFKGELSGLGLPSGGYDVVTMWHVLEHTQDPLDALVSASRLLKEDGLLVVAVPNAAAWIYRAAYRIFKGKCALSVVDREPHAYHFTPKTLAGLLDKAGLRPLEIAPDTGYRDWARTALDAAPMFLYYIFGVNTTSAFEVFAAKKI